jgi:TetR/AcrR family transcriptional repressor of nem operon
VARPRAFDATQVVDAVVDDFWSSTYAATSTDDLCRSAGLSRSSLYNAFGSKRELYLAAIHRYAELKAEQRAALLSLEETGRALLEQVIATTLDEQWADAGRRACFGINACVDEGAADDEIAASLERNARAYDRMLAEVIRRGQADGTLRADRPADDLATTLHAFVDGLQVRARIRPSRDDQRRDVATALSLL